MTTFHHKFSTRERKVLAYRLTHQSSMTIVVQSFIQSVIQNSYHSDIKYHMTLNIMFSVLLTPLILNILLLSYIILACQLQKITLPPTIL